MGSLSPGRCRKLSLTNSAGNSQQDRLDVQSVRASVQSISYVMAPTFSESSLLPPEDNASLDAVEIDETTTSSDETTSEASQADSRHSQTSHACTFDIQFDTLI